MSVLAAGALGSGAVGAGALAGADAAGCCGAGVGSGVAGLGRGPPGLGPGRAEAASDAVPLETVPLDTAAPLDALAAVPADADAVAGVRAPGLGAPDGLADSFFPPSLDGNDSRSRRATGASTVDDADLTNSPCSFRRSSTCLLVTPSSLASSCTRALPATALLTWRSSGPPATTSVYVRNVLIVETSRCAHVFCYLFLTRLGAISSGDPTECFGEVVGVHGQTGDPQRRTERPAPQRGGHAVRPWMQPGTSSRHGLCVIDDDCRRIIGIHCHDAYQFSSHCSLPTSDAHPDRTIGPGMGVDRQLSLNHRSVYRAPPHPEQSPAQRSLGASASDRISMRQPVRRAARRAFWPSLPIANDS